MKRSYRAIFDLAPTKSFPGGAHCLALSILHQATPYRALDGKHVSSPPGQRAGPHSPPCTPSTGAQRPSPSSPRSWLRSSPQPYSIPPESPRSLVIPRGLSANGKSRRPTYGGCMGVAGCNPSPNGSAAVTLFKGRDSPWTTHLHPTAHSHSSAKNKPSYVPCPTASPIQATLPLDLYASVVPGIAAARVQGQLGRWLAWAGGR